MLLVAALVLLAPAAAAPSGTRLEVEIGGLEGEQLRNARAFLSIERYKDTDDLTEASVALTLRWGRIHTPWWSFVPERAEYMMEPAPVFGGASPDGPRELYAWAGIKGRARLYNAFLQGQFRDSDLTYDFEDTRPLIGELWAGVTAELAAGYRLSYVLRYQSSELRTRPGDRDLFWGGVSVSRSF